MQEVFFFMSGSLSRDFEINFTEVRSIARRWYNGRHDKKKTIKTEQILSS
jgi:hypothetical protein